MRARLFTDAHYFMLDGAAARLCAAATFTIIIIYAEEMRPPPYVALMSAAKKMKERGCAERREFDMLMPIDIIIIERAMQDIRRRR